MAAKNDFGSNIPDVLDASASEGKKKRKIILERNEAIPPTGLPIGLNGNVVVVVPGVTVELDDDYLRVLDDAVMSVAAVDPASGQVIGTEDRQRFPYRFV